MWGDVRALLFMALVSAFLLTLVWAWQRPVKRDPIDETAAATDRVLGVWQAINQRREQAMGDKQQTEVEAMRKYAERVMDSAGVGAQYREVLKDMASRPKRKAKKKGGA